MLLGIAAVVIATFRAEASAQDVAARVAPVVAAEQIRDAREQRTRNARALLEAANAALGQRDLPTVQDPGPLANAEQISTAASTAQVLALLPEPIAEDLRAQGRDVLVLPQPDGTLAPVDRGPDSSGGSQDGGGADGGGLDRSVEPSSVRVPPTVRPPRGGSGSGTARPAPPTSQPPAPTQRPVPVLPPASPGPGGPRLDLPLLPDLQLPDLGVRVRVV